jgi:hypothetical protein
MLGDVAFAQAPFASQGGNTFNSSVSETGSISDSLATPIVIYGGTVSESISALDSLSVLATFVGDNSESASGADVFDTLNNTFNVVLLDGASGIDATSVQADFSGIVAETIAAIDSLLSQADFVTAIAEAASANDAVQGGLLLLVSIDEAASGVDAQVGNVIYPVTIQEFAAGLDNLTVIKTLNASVTGVQLVVRVGNILIWSQVNDNQDPNWQNITNPNSPGWVVVPS